MPVRRDNGCGADNAVEPQTGAALGIWRNSYARTPGLHGRECEDIRPGDRLE
jgi:hypothetical protein